MLEVFSGNSWPLPIRQSDWQVHNRAAHSLKLIPRNHDTEVSGMLTQLGIDPNAEQQDSFSDAMKNDALMVAYLPPERPSAAEQITLSVKRGLEDKNTLEAAIDRIDTSLQDFDPEDSQIKWFKFRPNTELQRRIVKELEPVEEPYVNFLSSLSFIATRGSELIVADTFRLFELGDEYLFNTLLEEELEKLPDYGPNFSS